MDFFRRISVVAVGVGLIFFGGGPWAFAQTDYPYYGGPSTPPPDDNQQAPPPYQAPPPVVYRPVPVYRPYYRVPSWASPTSAALGPWKWNVDIGGGPTTITGPHDTLTGGSNFQFGAGYNFTPRAGFVFEFGDQWLGVTDKALNDNNAINGDAAIWSITLNPIWRFRIGGPIGGYLIGGGGYYQRE